MVEMQELKLKLLKAETAVAAAEIRRLALASASAAAAAEYDDALSDLKCVERVRDKILGEFRSALLENLGNVVGCSERLLKTEEP